MNSSWSKRAYTSSKDNPILTVATVRKKDSGKIFGIPQPFFEFILFNGTTSIDVQESKDGHCIRRCCPTFLSSFFLGKYNFVTGGSFSVLTATTKKRWKNPGSIVVLGWIFDFLKFWGKFWFFACWWVFELWGHGVALEGELLRGEVVVISAFPEISAASNANGNETRFGHWIGQTWRPQIVSDEQLEVGPWDQFTFQYTERSSI